MNRFLKDGEVVIALSDGFCPSNGAFSAAIVFDGVDVWEHVYSGNHKNGGKAMVNCTQDQLQLAAKEWRKTRKEVKAGSVVILGRSRKAPNKNP